MLTKRVIAANITNLTDARYFAARGVDYLMFEVKALSLDKILEIKEWIEGPEHILSFDLSSLSLLEEAIIKIKPACVTGIDPQVHHELKQYESHVEVITREDEARIVIDEVTYKKVTTLKDLRALEEEAGVIVSGGDENEVGVKDFDVLDEILDHLEDV